MNLLSHDRWLFFYLGFDNIEIIQVQANFSFEPGFAKCSYFKRETTLFNIHNSLCTVNSICRIKHDPLPPPHYNHNPFFFILSLKPKEMYNIEGFHCYNNPQQSRTRITLTIETQ